MKFVNPFRKAFFREQIRIFNFFARVQLFHGLSYEEIAEFLPYLHVRSYQKNEAIFFRNDPNQALYIIKSGTVELSLDVKDDFETLAFAQKYVSIGNNALLEGRKRHYNAVAYTENCELYVIPQVNLLEIFERHLSIKPRCLLPWPKSTTAIPLICLKPIRIISAFSTLAKPIWFLFSLLFAKKKAFELSVFI